MDEINLEMSHDLPMNNVSKEFPNIKIFRWCNSFVDYLEFHGDRIGGLALINFMKVFTEKIHSEIVYSSVRTNTVTVMIACRCSVINSTARMVESENCLWRAPVTYENGKELLTVYSPDSNMFQHLYNKLEQVASVKIVGKKIVKSEDLRETWMLSLSDLFSGMTDRQERYLAEAISSGYFDIPKKVSIEKLASNNGVSKSTMQEHLSKAETRIFKALEPYLRLYHGYMKP